MECKTIDYGCAYHACMSDECQKDHVLSTGANWGFGRCEEIKSKVKIPAECENEDELLECEECGSLFSIYRNPNGMSYCICPSCYNEYLEELYDKLFND